ncbi:Ig-like domain-containing protein, partial [Diaphorobacter ruginosibacter]|uniref:Ig-like domain-containing protein n=1 Tax=Diaphorobacter ruginosibacter TaxID=1715720 RepID=UPI00334294F1
MTTSMQSVDVSVVGKHSAVSKFGVGSDVALNEPSVVKLAVTRADVRAVSRSGDDLIVTLTNGEKVTVQRYFLNAEGAANNLVLDDELEGLWQLQLGDASGSGELPFGFSSIQSIDPLLEQEPSEERDAVLGSWGAAISALTIGSFLVHELQQKSDSPNPEPEAVEKIQPNAADVNPVNGKDPITGHAQPGMTVTVTFPNGSTAVATTDADGHFSVDNPGLNHEETITVVVTSPEGVDSDPTTATVDALAPERPVVDPVNGSGDITGTAEPGSEVRVIFPDGTESDPVIVGEDGSFHVSNPGLKDGDEIKVVAQDPAGNVSDPTIIVVDAVPPVLTISDDVPGIVGHGGEVTFTFTFSEDVTDFDAGKISVDGGVAGVFTVVSGSVYTLVVTPNGDPEGTITVSVAEGAAMDSAGNPSSAASATQDFDTVAPLASALKDIVLIDDVGDIKGEIHSGDTTDDSKPTYSGTTDPRDVYLVQVLDNGKVIGEAHVNEDGTWSFEPSYPLPAGPHEFQARPVDEAGNVGGATDAIAFELYGPAPAAPAITGVYDDVAPIVGNIEKEFPTDDNTPTLKGTATPSTLVKVWDGETLVGSAEVDAEGNWEITTSSLSEGEHKLIATATDGAGQVSPPTGEYFVLVDVTPPGKPDVPLLSAGDGGAEFIPEGSTVEVANPTFSGTGEPGETVDIYDGGQLLGSTTVDTHGDWTYTPTEEMSEGVHEVTVTLSDKAGNTSESSESLHFTVDTDSTPLSILRALDDVGPITGAVPNNGATDDASPTLVGKAPAGITVTVYEGETVLGAAKADAAGVWELALVAQAEGSHNYTAKGQNEAGTPLEAKFTLTIDTTPPQVPTIDSLEDDVGSNMQGLVSGGFTDDTTPTLHGTGSPGAKVDIFDNGEPIGSTEVGDDGQWHHTVNPALTTEGEHVLTATSTDAVGNESAPSAEFIVNLDVTPPDVSDVVLSMDPVAGDDYVNIEESEGDVTLSGQLANVPSDVADTRITVTVNGSLHEATLVGSSWSASVPGSELVAAGEGGAAVDVKAILSDAAGNEAQLQITHGYEVKTTPIADDWEKIAATLWDDVEPEVGEITSGMATDDARPVYKGVADSSKGVAFVEILDNGKVISRVAVQEDGSWSFEPEASLARGDHAFQARPVDVAENKGNPTNVIDFALQAPLGPRPLPPAIEDVQDNVGPVQGNIQKGVPTDDSTPTLSGSAEPEAVVNVFDVVDGQLKLVGTATADDKGSWSVQTSPLSEGAHNLVATATNAAGQESDQTGEYTILVDTTAPSRPTSVVVVDKIGDMQGVVGDGQATDDATPEIKGEGEAGAGVTVFDNGKEIGTTTVGDDGHWSLTPSTPLADGQHSISVTLTDKAGNVSEPGDPAAFTVDTSGLELVITRVEDDHGLIQGALASGDSTDDTTPTFVGKATAGATVTINEGATTLGSVVADGSGNWSLELPVQAEGAHQYVIKAVSVAGNVAQTQFALTMDITASSAPVIVEVRDDVGSKQNALTEGGVSVTDDTTPTLIGTGTPNETITIYDNGKLAGSTTVDADGNW